MKSSLPILTINLAQICKNYRQIAGLCGSSIVSAVVKADGYGLGASPIALALFDEGCRNFFVASCNEGIELRKCLSRLEKINIYVLHGPYLNDVAAFITYNLTPVINNLAQILLWQEVACANNKKLLAILHVNTGMHRIGMSEIELEQLIKAQNISNIEFEYIMSHLACSDDRSNPYNLYQLDNFKKILEYFPGIKGCFANSDGIFLGKEYHFDMVRTGAALYGINHNLEHKDPLIVLKNPIKLFAPIIQLQTVAPGSKVGYNTTFTTEKPCIIATIAVGYADGYLRHFGKYTTLFIEEHEVAIVGRISMDFITIDVTNVPENKIFLGALIEVIGDHITPRKIGEMTGTIGYEILTLLGRNRYHKQYNNRI